MVKTRVQVTTKNGGKQYTITIPRAMAEGIGLRKGDDIEWTYEHGGLLLRRK